LNLTECRPEVASAPDGEEQHLASHLVLSGGGDARNSHAQVDSQFAQVTPANSINVLKFTKVKPFFINIIFFK
jgi:hypothetical protein